MAGDVRQRLLDDAVDDELLELAQQRPRAVGGEVRRDAPALAEQPHLRAQRGHQAVVVERRRAQLAGQAEQLLHRLVGEALGLLELVGELGRRVLGGRGEAQRDGGERLVDLVVQVAGDARALGLLGAQHGGGAADALVLQAREHEVEGLAQARDVLRLAVLRLRAHAGQRQVDGTPSCASATPAGRSGGA